MSVRYCTWALLVLLAVPAAAQESQLASTSRSYTIFVRGMPIGREDVTVQQDASGTTIVGRGRAAAQASVVMRRAEVRYGPDWTPQLLLVDALVDGAETTLKTTFANDTAVSEHVVSGQQVSHTDEVPRDAFVLPTMFFGAYEAIARRLDRGSAGAEHHAFLTPQQPPVPFRVSSVTTERMQTGTSAFNVHRYVLLFPNPNGLLAVNLYADDSGSLLRVNVPAQAIDIVRDDLAASTARTFVYSNPGDEAVIIPAAGFNLGATVTKPASVAGGTRLPAVILLGTSEIGDRDGAMDGVPIIGQLAGALAEAGFVAVRYDQRGHGQSGGRAESATMRDLAEDARAVVRWLADRRDIDRDRIAVVGYGDGAWLALLAASRERRIAAVVTIAAASVPGAELVLEQQRNALEQLNASPEDRQAKVELQSRINAAVMSEGSWEGIPPEIRRQADTPWFQSFLAFDPAEVLEDVKQPLLLVHGALDRQTPVSHLDRLADIARRESDSKSVTVVTVRGINHLLVPAFTGDVAEYASLEDRNISNDLTSEVAGWLTTAFAKRR